LPFSPSGLYLARRDRGALEAQEAVVAAAAQACIPTAVVVASSWARSADHALARLASQYT
jgi:adenosine deaminase